MKELGKDKRRNFYYQLSFSFLLIFFFLLLLEVLSRLLFSQLGMSSEIRVPDPVLHHSFIPGSKTVMNSQEFKVEYRINKIGLRDKEVGPKKPGVFRILVVGDSVVEGWGVELKESWVKQLEKKLNESFGEGKFEVINGGVASYSPFLYYLFLKKKGLELRPDLVIMMMDMGDPSDDYDYSRQAVFSSFGEPKACPGGYYREKGLKRFLSYFSLSLRRTFRLYLILDYLFSKGEKGVQEGFRPMLFGIRSTESWEKAWSLSKKYILLSRDLLKKKGIPMVFTVCPPAFLVGDEEWREGRRLLNFNLEGVNFEKMFTDFKEFAYENRLPYIELLSFLQSYPEHPLYYSYDIHPNPVGHRVIAERIFEELISLGLLEKVPQ